MTKSRIVSRWQRLHGMEVERGRHRSLPKLSNLRTYFKVDRLSGTNSKQSDNGVG